MGDKANCFTCKHRRRLIGDNHSRCVHPAFAAIEENPLYTFLEVYGKLAGPFAYTSEGCVVVGDPHGIRNGWFNHPFNFDPVWLISCTGYDSNIGVNDDTEQKPCT